MWFEQMIRRESGCVSYMIGSAKTGECAVIDALWDVAPYLEMAKRNDAKIRYIIDSHTHADHVSGARRLAQRSGGELIMPRLAELSHPVKRVDDGDFLRMGDVLLEIVHTPGHRPEMMSILVTDLTRSDRPWCILTGDFLLVGDLGRPDLAQEGDEGARLMFDRALPRLQALDDYVEVYPGHIAGSACGRVTSGKSVSSIGFERRFNWLLQMRDRAAFVAEMNAGQPARPANAANIVAINQGKQPLTMEMPGVSGVSADALKAYMEAGHLVIDARTPARFATGHLPGAYNVPLESSQFEQWVGWVTPNDSPFLLMLEALADVEHALQKLAFVGLDSRVAGYVCSDVVGGNGVGLMTRSPTALSPQQLYECLNGAGKNGRQPGLRVLDVRTCSEWQSGHIRSAQQWNLQQLREQIEALPLAHDEHVAVVCASGMRSSIASSILMHHGYRHVYTVTGGMNAWKTGNLPVLECSDDEACPDLRRREVQFSSLQRVPASKHRCRDENEPAAVSTPLLVFTEACQDPNLPYWMEMGARQCAH
jgi:glyoxylase-like metal-dependent hydrolase (beta-lactamase superfamily II)/rhodanese-related sulfurtransferase